MELLKKLTQLSGVSANENTVADLIINEIKDFSDEYYRDDLGNLIVRKKGSGKKVLFAAHMDEIGLMANYIDDKGFIRFAPVGGVDAFAALYQRVVFANGVEGCVCFESKNDVKKDLKFSNMYIDIGASGKEEAESKVNAGDVAVFKGDFSVIGSKVISKALDNRIGVYALVEAIKKINSNTLDLYFVFSSQEEIGLKGAKVASYNVEPDIAISVDVTGTGDTPGCETMDVKLGDGVAIKIMDKSVITHKGLRDFITRLAKDNDIAHQFEILSYGGTDAGAMQLTKSGAVTGALSIPVRYVHTTCETASMADVEACIQLLCEICKKDFIFV